MSRSAQLVLLALLGSCLVLLAACGGSNEPTEAPAEALEEPNPKTEVANTEPAPEPEPSEAPLEEVGVLTGRVEEGAVLKERFEIGPLIYGSGDSLPDEALNACSFLSSPGAIDASVYARGSIDFSYTHGTLPIGFEVGYIDEAVEGEDLTAFLAYDVDGGWICNSEEFGATIELEPGENQEVPIWFVGYDVLSNARPKLPTSVTDTWHFNFIGPEAEYRLEGPGLGQCGEDGYELFLFNRSGEC